MEWLLTLIPVGLVVLVCGGLHMLMMRGMHGGHDTASGHGGDPRVIDLDDHVTQMGRRVEPRVARSRRPDGTDEDRVAELESQVEQLQQQIEALYSDGQKTGNWSSYGRPAALRDRKDPPNN